MPTFESDADRASQDEVRAIMAERFGLDVRSFGTLSEVDFYLARAGKVVAVAELKVRKNASTAYPTVFLSVRKWLALAMLGFGHGCHALFVARFTDCIKWIRLSDVDASRTLYFDTRRVYRIESDRELVIEVPVADMRTLHVFDGAADGVRR